MTATHLTARDPAPGHDFAHPEHTDADLAVLRAMLRHLRAHVATLPRRGGARADTATDPMGAVDKLVMPSIDRLRQAPDLVAVGFFGQARTTVDHAPIVDLEAALIADMPSMPGLAAYYNRFVPGEGWGNLVLFTDLDAEAAWGDDDRHRDAVRRSRHHYHSIRLHLAALPGGIDGGGDLEPIRTRYLDYGAPGTTWRATRSYG